MKRIMLKPSLVTLGTTAPCLMIGKSIISPDQNFPRSESGVSPNSSGASDSLRRLLPDVDDDDFSFDVNDLDD